MEITFTEQDQEQILQRGSRPEEVLRQFSYFEKGFPPVDIVRPAWVGDGIIRLDEEKTNELISHYAAVIEGKKIVRFVPASGAASRMFKELFSYLEEGNAYREKGVLFLKEVKNFPFYEDLKEVLSKAGYRMEELIEQGDYKTVIRYLLFEDGLNYSHLPKGLLKFHRYEEGNRFAVEEHLVEAALYGQSADGRCYLHFTVSPHHQAAFEEVIAKVKDKYELRFGVVYEISYSVQNPATDTLAATLSNEPFRDESGALLFRPGGHGALLRNLSGIDGDLIFVKNIDNVTTEKEILPTVKYKKLLAAYLLEIQKKVFTMLGLISKEMSETVKRMIVSEVFSIFGVSLSSDISPQALFQFLNRPLRVCGMVKNEGEPGGGPFWVRKGDDISLQIVESSQINLDDSLQKDAMEASTHFNPVDMVCAIKDFKGERFNLEEFVDEKTGFISEKSYGDRKLKAMELPGLWNGAMADWLTVFVEVPLSTFHPVKTVFDLLRR